MSGDRGGSGPVHGVSLLELLADLPEASRGPLGGPVRSLLQGLSAVEFRSWATGRHFVHAGVVQSLETHGLPVEAGLPLELPGLQRGVPFTLTFLRPGDDDGDDGTADPGTIPVEPPPAGWILDLFVERIGLRLEDPIPAIRIPSAPGRPARLVPADGGITARTGGGGGVRFLARGVVRLVWDGQSLDVRLVPPPDPLDPEAAEGTVVELRAEPPHFLFSRDGTGLSVGALTLDDSERYTPARVVERGHDARWRGIAADELTLYLPHNLPVVGDVSVGVRGLILGWGAGAGVQGDFVVELGQTLDNPRVGIQFEQELEDAEGRPEVVVLGPVGGPAPDEGPGAGFAVRLDPRTPGGAGARRARVRARLTETASDGTPLEGRWRIPGREAPLEASETGWMELAFDEARGVGPLVHVSRLARDPETDERIAGPEVAIAVLPPQPEDLEANRAPWIGARLAEGIPGPDPAPTWPDVVELAGPPRALEGAELVALVPAPFLPEGETPPEAEALPFTPLEGAPEALAWLVDGEEVARGLTLRLGAATGLGEDALAEGPVTRTLTLRREGRPDRNLRVQLLAPDDPMAEALWIGRQGALTRVPLEGGGAGGVGVAFGAPEAPTPDRVLRTAWLTPFHRAAKVGEGATPAATIGDDGRPRVAPDTLGEFGLSRVPPVPPPDWNHPRCLRLFSELNDPQWAYPWGRALPPIPDPVLPLEPPPGADAVHAATVLAYERRLGTYPLRTDPRPPRWHVPEIAAWMARFPEGSRFVVVGRCCDRGSVRLNRELAEKRAKLAAEFLQALLTPGALSEAAFDGALRQAADRALEHLAGSSIVWRGEQTDRWSWETDAEWRSSTASSAEARMVETGVPEVLLHVGWRRTGPAEPAPNPYELDREESRGVEIYVVVPPGVPLRDPVVLEREPAGGDAAAPEPSGVETGERVGELRLLVPGAEHPPAAEPPPPPRSPAFPFRFLLRGRWDSPAFLGNEDFLPSLVEMEFDWKANEVALPGGSSPVGVEPTADGVRRDPDTNAHIFRILGRFSHDARSGQTLVGFAWDSPGDDRGIFHLVGPPSGSGGDGSSAGPGDFVAVALGLGPALLGSLEPADAGGQAVALAGLLAGAGLVTGFGLVRNGRVTVQTLEAEMETPGLGEFRGMRLRVTMDYHARFGVTTGVLTSGALDLRTAEADPVEIRYRRVGLEFRDEGSFPDNLNFLFGDVSFQVANPGRWEIEGDLGRLLGITALRLGTGSVWLEVTLAPGLDLGVVRITDATVRIVLPGEGDRPGFELRGLAASVDIPGVLRGDGRLALGGDGSLAASLSLELVPAKLRVDASLVLRPPMVVVEVGVILPVGLPLGATGLGIFGFRGRFVSNGTRALPEGAGSDPVERELAWWRAPTIHKYRVEEGQYALGLGVVVGTLPDTGFTFHAQGMLVVEFPEPSVVLGIEARFAAEPSAPAEQGGGPGGGGMSLQLLGLVAIDRTGVALAIRGELRIPEILLVTIPISAYFPAPGGPGASVGYFIHVGSDGVLDRPGDPVTAVILPGSLDLRVWSFFMIREKGITALGGRDGLDFDGFSLGFGAGWELRWGERPLYLRVSATFLLGLGTRPFVLGGFVEVVGELFLLVVGIGIRGELQLRIDGAGWSLSGRFCGRVSLLFFTIEECVQVSAGSGTGYPPPPPLLDGIGLTDPLGRLVRAPRDAEGNPGVFADGEPVAWPDALPTLHFQRRVWVDLDPEAGGFRPEPDLPGPGGAWSGKAAWTGTDTSRTLYRLRGVRLEREVGGTWVEEEVTGWPSTWWFPSFRAALPDAGESPESELEGWDLALLTRDPIPTAFEHLADGGAGVEADPAQALARVCTPAPAPSRACIYGGDGVRQGPVAVSFGLRSTEAGSGEAAPDGAAPDGAGPPSPYRSRFRLEAREGLHAPEVPAEDLVSWLELLGYVLAPGLAEGPGEGPPPPAGVAPDHGGWRLPQVTHAGRPAFTPGLESRILEGLHEPELLLRVCLDVPTPPPEERRCQDFGHLRPGMRIDGPYRVAELVIRNTTDLPLAVTDQFPAGLPDGRPELFFFQSKGIVIEFAEAVARVELDVGVATPEPLRILARDAGGEVVADTATPAEPGQVYTVAVEAEGIRSVEVASTSGVGALVQVCWTRRGTSAGGVAPGAGAERFVAAAERRRGSAELPGFLPQVEGWTGEAPAPGRGEPWIPEMVGQGTAGGRACVWVRYRPRSRGTGGVVWRGFRILPYPLLEVTFVRLCGVAPEARRAWALDEARRERLQDVLLADWTREAGSPGGGGGGEPGGDPGTGGEGGDPEARPGRWRRGGGSQGPLLRAGTRYRVAVDLQVAQWLDDGSGGEPPEPAEVPWDTAAADCPGPDGVCVRLPETRTFPFRTAPVAPLADEDLPDPTAQWHFDPRALVRHILGLEPGGDRPTHFLADPLQVHVGVGWVEDLLAAHGLALHLRVRRTDPGPSPQPEGAGDPPFLEQLALDVDPERIRMQWGPLPRGLLTPMERRLAEATAEASCLPERPGRGATASLLVPLEPRASYDLIVAVAPAREGEGEEVEILRTHFRTSRYADPGELLAGAGFPDDEAPGGGVGLPPREHLVLADDVPVWPPPALGPLPPAGAIGAGAAGDGGAPADDAALDEALALLGMDPWPLPETPEVVAIWRLGGEGEGGWRLVGILVDSDEALVRPVRHDEPATGLRAEALRLHLPGLPPGDPAGIRPFVLARQSAAGTRLLFLAPAPVAIPRTAELADARLEFVLARGAGPATRRWRGARLLSWLPRLVLHESEPPEEDLP